MNLPADQQAPHFVTCPCQHCSGKIEFDANLLEAGAKTTVRCPHCGLETVIFVPESQQVPPVLSVTLKARVQTTPCTFSDFVGQRRIKAWLEVAVTAARQRQEPLDHVLLIGPPSSGKSTLAGIIAARMNATLTCINGSAVKEPETIAGLITNLEEGDVLFIDDINWLPGHSLEYLCPAMDAFKMDIVIDEGQNPRSVKLNLPRFTLVGTTRRKELVSAKLLSCFQIVQHMEVYNNEELADLARRTAKWSGFEIEENAAERVASSADGTPVDVLRRIRNVRYFAQVKQNGVMTLEDVEEALKMLASFGKNLEMTKCNQRQTIPTEVRRQVWRRDEGKCVKCGSRENLEYDHIIPVSKGGSSTVRNIQLLCEVCNRTKSDLIQ